MSMKLRNLGTTLIHADKFGRAKILNKQHVNGINNTDLNKG